MTFKIVSSDISNIKDSAYLARDIYTKYFNLNMPKRTFLDLWARCFDHKDFGSLQAGAKQYNQDVTSELSENLFPLATINYSNESEYIALRQKQQNFYVEFNKKFEKELVKADYKLFFGSEIVAYASLGYCIERCPDRDRLYYFVNGHNTEVNLSHACTLATTEHDALFMDRKPELSEAEVLYKKYPKHLDIAISYGNMLYEMNALDHALKATTLAYNSFVNELNESDGNTTLNDNALDNRPFVRLIQFHTYLLESLNKQSELNEVNRISNKILKG